MAGKSGGTAIITRLAVVPGSSTKYSKGRYSTCIVQLPFSGVRTDGASVDATPTSTIGIVSLHLDHRKETTRIQELHTICSGFIQKKLPIPDVLLGDFNALTEDDYTKAEWTEIANIRAYNHWESPLTDLTRTLTMVPTKKKSLLPIQLCDAGVAVSHLSGPTATCRFGTRIDYIYFNQKRLQEVGWKLVSCEHFGNAHVANGGTKDLSDHNLVVATFENEI